MRSDETEFKTDFRAKHTTFTKKYITASMNHTPGEEPPRRVELGFSWRRCVINSLDFVFIITKFHDDHNDDEDDDSDKHQACQQSKS